MAASMVSEFFVGKKANHPVLAVEARLSNDLAGAHPADSLGQKFPTVPGNLIQRCMFQDPQFWPQPGKQFFISALHPFGVRSCLKDFAQDFTKGNQASEGRSPWMKRFRRRRSIGQLADPIQHPQRNRPAALGTSTAVLPGLRRLPADAALPMAVQVVFALFGEKFDGAGVSLAGVQGLPHGEII